MKVRRTWWCKLWCCM